MAEDIVVRLRREGEDAMRRHLSLGMHGLCAEAADEIEKLRQMVDIARTGLLRVERQSETARAEISRASGKQP